MGGEAVVARLHSGPRTWRDGVWRTWAIVVVATCLAISTLAIGAIRAYEPRHPVAELRVGELSPQGQATMSESVGGQNSAFRARGRGDGYRLVGTGVTVDLGMRGISLHAGTGSASMSVVGIGRHGDLRRVAEAKGHAVANRVQFDREGFGEWYVAGPLGVEQGFTVTRRPLGAGRAVTLSMQLGGSLRSELTSSGVLFLSAGHVRLRYGNPVALDARGRSLPAYLTLEGRSLALNVVDRGARYPLRIDPLIQQGGKLTGSGEAGGGGFGSAVALSPDGNTAVIGGPSDNGNAGAAWVFVRSGATWSQEGPKLTGSDETGAGRFGNGVAVSGDGNTALISAPDDNSQGAAFVFTRSGGAWSQQGPKLFVSTCTPSPCANNSNGFGSGVALSSDGNTALIGGVRTGTVASAWAYTRLGAMWTQQGPPLTGSGGSTSNVSGTPVALSADGNTALLGGPETTRSQGIVTYGNVGSAWVYARSSGMWSQQAQFTAGDQTDPMNFGASVGLSADGNTALIGAPNASIETGAAFGFARSGGSWAQQGPAVTGNGAAGPSNFGSHLALSGDGSTALIGGYRDNGNQGAVWSFALSGGTWVQQGPKLSGVGFQGALPGTPSGALVGNPSDGNGVGAVWPLVLGHTLSISLGGTGHGSVTGPAINCAPTCAHTYPDGSSVLLTASSSSGSTFAGWSGGGCSGTGICTVFIGADTVVTATFSAAKPAAVPKLVGTAAVPKLVGLRIAPQRITVSGRLVKKHCVAPNRANRRRRSCLRPVSMRISYQLSLRSTVTFTLKQWLTGRLVNGRCVSATRANRKHRSCARLLPVRGSFGQDGQAGPNTLTFTGRIGRRNLGPGSYQLTAAPSSNGRNGAPQTTQFDITH